MVTFRTDIAEKAWWRAGSKDSKRSYEKQEDDIQGERM